MTDAQSHAVLRDTAFRAPENHATPASQATVVASPLNRVTTVYSLPTSAASNAKVVRAFHLYLMVCGTSNVQNRAKWHNYLATVVSQAFSSIKSRLLTSSSFREHVLTNDIVDLLTEWYDRYREATDPEAGDVLQTQARSDMSGMVFGLTLPDGVPTFDINVDVSTETEAIYGHVSLVIFLGGKTITDTNRPAITQKRPGAIERKYFEGTPVGPLSGSLQLSHQAHSSIHSSFSTLGHLRKAVFTQVALFNNNADDPIVEVVATTTRLMRYAGMQQAILVDQFLSAHEEAFRIPILIPSIQAYTASMKDLAAAPVEQRPYYKLIHGDTTRAFNRNDLMNIVVVAVMEARETNPTMKQYAIPANHQLIMEKYVQALAILKNDE